MPTHDEYISLVRAEIAQRREEGCDVDTIDAAVADSLSKEELCAILRDLDELRPAESFRYVEPSTLDEIRAERPDGPRRMEVKLEEAEILDHIHGAWLGRAAGCALGKPVEGWHKKKIGEYLQLADALPLNDYVPLLEKHPEELTLHSPDCTRGSISYMARNDDMDYTILGLHILESYGLDFTTGDVATTWLNRLPYNLVYTAERATYRNLVNGIEPPETATVDNPYRE